MITESIVLAAADEANDELERAQLLGELSARVGFDWKNPFDALDKVSEELNELREALESGGRDATADELGDVLFSIVNVARLLEIDAAEALGGTNRKFARRFRRIEEEVARSRRGWEEYSLEEMDAIWRAAKKEERPAQRPGVEPSD